MALETDGFVICQLDQAEFVSRISVLVCFLLEWMIRDRLLKELEEGREAAAIL